MALQSGPGMQQASSAPVGVMAATNNLFQGESHEGIN
jgi:hypothetical protein